MMTKLREIRLRIVTLFSKFEAYLIPAGKFILAMTVFCIINSQFGFMTKIAKFPIALILALFCSFMPMNMIVVLAAFLTLLHAYELSMLCAGVLAVVYVIMFLLYFKFSPKDTLAVVLTPICFVLKIPYVIPMSFGLVGTPGSAVSVGCGVVAYYVLVYLKKAAEALEKAGEDDILTQVRTLLIGLISNKAMIVCAFAFAITVFVVYIVRRLSIKYAWTIAMIVGALSNILIILIGDVMFTTNVSIVGLLFGTILGCGIVKVIQFFVFDLDYSRTEKVQFEDDDYYYYVKAVPKVKVSEEKKVPQVQERVRRSDASERRERPERASRISADVQNENKAGIERAAKNDKVEERPVRQAKSQALDSSNGNTEKINVRTRREAGTIDEAERRAEIARRREAQRRREQRLNRQAMAKEEQVDTILDDEVKINQEADDDLGLSRRIAYQRRKLEERIGNSDGE